MSQNEFNECRARLEEERLFVAFIISILIHLEQFKLKKKNNLILIKNRMEQFFELFSLKLIILNWKICSTLINFSTSHPDNQKNF